MTVIGFDIGGSKTRAVLADGDTVLAKALGGGANIASVGLAEAIRQPDIVLAALPAVGVTAVCAGAAGADSPQTIEVLRQLLADRLPGVTVLVVHDARLLLAAAGLDTGVAVISGTGSVAWGIRADGTDAPGRRVGPPARRRGQRLLGGAAGGAACVGPPRSRGTR